MLANHPAADIFPMMSESEFAGLKQDISAGRLTHLNKSQRAILMSRMMRYDRHIAQERAADKAAWIYRARIDFQPGTKHPCVVCGRYQAVSHAHHVLPLSLQHDLGITSPIQQFCWVCPTHHAAFHLLITSLINNVGKSLDGFPPEEMDRMHKLNVDFVQLYIDHKYTCTEVKSVG